ncbi:MAG: alpha/beta hydrolase [Thermodesulfobacteriota bacterium]
MRLCLRLWPGEEPGFVLLHGLASNARTWDLVARELSAAGHAVAAPDLRGHGCSEKPPAGYGPGDVAADLAGLVGALGWERPVVVGQSWGGNVVLELGARHPGLTRGLGLVDGGWIALRERPGATWEETARELRPPELRGTPWERLRERIRAGNPEWTEEAVDAVMACFERLPDGTVRPWLTLERHLAILRGLWEQTPSALYPQVGEPVVLCAAEDGSRHREVRRREVAAARRALPRSALHWFPDTHHDIHLHRPQALAAVFLRELRQGGWSGPE